MDLEDDRRAWDEVAAVDPLWAILSSPEKQHGRWDVSEFFATGAEEFEQVMARADALGLPIGRDTALDFGCGVGRVTKAMRSHFGRCVGVDVSLVMIEGAGRLNDGVEGLEFILNDRADLAVFDAATFDFVYSYIVLQHLSSIDLIDSYVGELVRVLRPDGLLVFQLPESLPFRRRLQPRPRAYALLRRMGVPASTLRARLGLHPIRMRSASREHVQAVLTAAGARAVDVSGHIDADGISNLTYWVTKA